MQGRDPLAILTGIFFLILGIGLTIVSFFFAFALFYAIPFLIVGVVILSTLSKQEYIEPIKSEKTKPLNTKKSKK